MKPDDILTYTELGELLDTEERHIIAGAVAKARRKLWDEYGRDLRAEPNQGYRMLRAEEHIHTAVGYQETARRRVSDAVVLIKGTRMEELSPAQRELAVNMGINLTNLQRAMGETQRVVQRHDDLIAKLTERVDRIESGERPPKIIEGETT